MDIIKLKELTDRLNSIKNSIRNKTDDLNSECEYMKYNQHIHNLDFSICGLKPTLADIEDVAKRLRIASETFTDCYVEISEEIETNPWNEWSSGDCTWFRFYGDLKFIEEEIEAKKLELRSEIAELELKCKEIEEQIKELVIGG
jgi:flagellar biosynthesis chaperone FliJ